MKTKGKNQTITIVLVLLALTTILAGVSCENPEVGLGPSVDLDAPRVQITAPDYMANVPEEFTLTGTVVDDRDIAEVLVEFKPGIRWWRFRSGAASWSTSTDQTTWTEAVGAVWTAASEKEASWSIPVSLTGSPEGEYTFRLTATDSRSNTSADSVKERTFVIDKTPPACYVTSPVLHLRTDLDPLALDNAEQLSLLFNGSVTLSGYEEENRNIQSLRIQLLNDDGDVCYNTILGENTTLWPAGSSGNLWNWTLTIPADQLVDAGGSPLTGKNPLQVITITTDRAGNEDTDNAGWFCWWPEADIPWATVPADGEVYPGTTIMGNAFDDDGIAAVRFTLRRPDLPAFLQESVFTPSSTVSTCTWSFTAPQGTGSYTLQVVPVDGAGTTGTPVTMSFTVPDIRVPQLTLTAPSLTASLFGNASGGVTFTGTATDDQSVTSLKLAWVKPGNDETPFLSGSATPWNIPSGSQYTDAGGNIIWEVTLGAPVTGGDGMINWSFSQSLNLFTDLGIGSGVTLSNQQFILRARDGEGLIKTQKAVTTGDWQAPVLGFNTVIVKSGGIDTPFTITPGLTLPKMNSGDQVMVTGTWTDDSTTIWSDKSRIGTGSLLWNGTSRALTAAADGTWSTVWFDPGTSSMASLEAALTDLGGNTAILRGSVFIEVFTPQLTRISSATDDGVYKAGTLIPLYCEFNKEVTFTGGTTPTLTLNNGKTATYVSGNGTAVHTFNYTVANDDDIAALNVTAFNTGSNVWRDSTAQVASLTLPAGVNALSGNRTLKIDTVAPTLTSLKNLTGAGAYKAGREILIEATFSENITYTGNWTLSLNAGTGVVATLQGRTDGQTLLFRYTVAAGQNVAILAVSALNKITTATLVDLAGNTLATVPVIPDSGVLAGGEALIDTAAPTVPVLAGVAAGTYYNGVTFSLTGEGGSVMEYSLNNGTDWETGSGTTVSDNGSYQLTARQTDAAGNVSPLLTAVAFTIDAGALVTSVTSSTADGTCKAGDVINIQVVFRKAVTVTGTPSLLLNAIDEDSDPVSVNYYSGSGTTTLTFRYTVGTRDRADRLDCASTAALDLTGDTLRDAAGNVLNSLISLPVPGSANSLAGTKNIKVLAGLPTLTGYVLSADNQTLTLTFSQPVYKGTGNIVVEQDSYVVPPLLTETRYNEIVSRLSGANKTLVQNSYSLTTNGGTYSGGLFVPDLSGKYVLKYALDTDDTALITAFRAAAAHQVTLPVTGSRVTGAGTATIVISLTGSYVLPVMGADYSLIIPATAFVDQLSQYYAGSVAGALVFTANGIEPPVFRLNKQSESLSLSGTTVTGVQPLTIPVKIDCPTPGTSIWYTLEYNEVLAAGNTAGAAPAEPGIPGVADTLYAGSFNIGTTTLNRGNKYYMKARAVKDGVWSAVSSEAAFRTVLRYASGSDRNYGARTVTPDGGGTSITGTDCSLWVRGSDCLAGSVTTPGFPLSWDDLETDKIRLMTRDGATWDWYWMTWDVGVTGYVLFVVGATPQTLSDAAYGPAWYGWWNNGSVDSLVDIPMLPGECRSLTGGGFEALGGYGGNIHARPGWHF